MVPRTLADTLQEVCHKYWPEEGLEKHGEFAVESTGEETHNGYIKRTFMVASKVRH